MKNDALAQKEASWGYVVPLLLLAAWLGIRALNNDALWLDEQLGYERIGAAEYGPLSPGEVIEQSLYKDRWPPIFDLGTHWWGEAAGWSHVAMRVPALLFGLLSVAMIYRVGCDLDVPLAGWYSAALLATTTIFVHYFHEVRGYTLHVLVTLSWLGLYWRVIRDLGNPARSAGLKWLAWLVLNTVVLMYTFPIAMPLMATLLLYHVFLKPKNERWRHGLNALLIGGISYLPWFILTMVPQVIKELETDAGMELGLALKTGLHVFSNGLPVLIILLAGYGALRLRGRGPGLIAFMFVGVTVITLAINMAIDFLFHIRHLLVLAPFAALLIGFTLVRLRQLQPMLPGVVLVIWMVVGIWHGWTTAFMDELPGSEKALSWPNFSATLETLQHNASPEDAVFFEVAAPEDEWIEQGVLAHYMVMYGPTLRFAQLAHIDAQFGSGYVDFPPLTGYKEKVRDFIGDARYVWTVFAPDLPVTDYLIEFENILNTNYIHCAKVLEYSDMQLDVYARTGASCEAFN